ncbi:head GIN domain-containing protein [Mucilaginibacter puniceus]
MKKALSTLFTSLLITTITLNVLAQTTQNRQVSGFSSISSSGSFNVHIRVDGTESLKITGDEDVINDIETTVSDGKLKIGTKNKNSWKLFNNKKIDIYITAKTLSGLSNSGSGNIKLEGSLTGNAELKTSGSGNITAAANGSDLQIAVSGSGSITSSVNTGRLTAAVSGSGALNLSGNAKNADIKVSGSGHIRANDLKSDAVDASISGSGNIHILANKSINARVSGSGRLIYTGNPTNVNSTTSGSGRVVKGK